MCVTFLLVNDQAKEEDEWQIVLINNRDEEYTRPTEPAQFKDGVLCGQRPFYMKSGTKHGFICSFSGRDLFPGKEGGTWLGVSEAGRIAVLLNIIPPVPPADHSQLHGRGNVEDSF